MHEYGWVAVPIEFDPAKTVIKPFLAETNTGLQARATLEYPNYLTLQEVDVALLLAPGLASPELVGLRHELAKLGHAVISFSQPRAARAYWEGGIGEVRYAVMAAVVNVARNAFGIEHVIPAPHSLASGEATDFIQRHGDIVHGAVYLAPARMIADDNMLTIAPRLTSSIAEEARHPGTWITGGRMVRHILESWSQYLEEARYGSNPPLIEEVHALAAQIALWVVQFEKDKAFPPILVNPHINDEVVGNYVTTAEPHHCHGSPLHSPVETAQAIDWVLTQQVVPPFIHTCAA